jgi:hypothetical protein
LSVLDDTIPHGLPDHLPEGERLLWQGRPDWQRLAINAFHVRKIAVYFGLIAAAQVASRLGQGEALVDAARSLPYVAGMAVAACSILAGLAYASAKTTLYTLTSKRLLMRIGIALPAYINLPLKHIDAAALAETGGGCGNICFRTAGETRLAYLLLWPHVKPWTFTKPQPALRDVANADNVASHVARALGGSHRAAAVVPQLTDNMVPAE